MPVVPGHGWCSTRRWGPLGLFNADVGTCELHRDRDTIEASALDAHVLVVDMLRGSVRGETGGSAVSLRRGDIGFFDLSEPARFECSDAASLGLVVPRERLVGETHALVLRESQLPTQMLARHLQGLLVPGQPPPHPSTLDGAIEGTLAVLQLCLDFAPALGRAKGVGGLRRNLLAFIEENLDNLELAPEFLCRKFGISRTWLYKIFAPEGGVKRVIRDKRLDAAFRDLCEDPQQRIIDVAYRRAFSSERQFQRAFLARFGVSPSAVRDARRKGLPLDAAVAARLPPAN